MENKPKTYAKQLIINDMAVRVGFEPTIGTWNLQLADSSLPGVPYLPGLPSRIAQNCPKPEQTRSMDRQANLTIRTMKRWRPGTTSRSVRKQGRRLERDHVTAGRIICARQPSRHFKISVTFYLMRTSV